VLLCEALDSARRGPLASSRRSVWLGEDQSDFVAGAMQCCERLLCELWSSGEN
jgi:hypothetical protein